MSSALPAPCDPAVARATPPGAECPHPKMVLAVTILASSLAFVDGSVVNVSLPAMGRSLGADSSALQWVVSAYLLPLSALLLLGGAAGDRFGRRRVLVGGTFFFAVASLACALATTMPLLVAARLAQGASAAFLMPNSLAILGQTFSGEAKGRAVGIWAAAGSITGAIGPVLGGWLVDRGSWRAIFLLNLPLAAAAIVLALRYVPEVKDDRAEPIDALGAILATAALATLTWSLSNESQRLLLVPGVALVIVLVVVEHRRGERAMLPLGLFASTGFIGLSLLTLFLYAALGGLLVLLPYVLIENAHYSSTAAGAALLPFPVVLALVSPRMGALVAKVGARAPLSIGPLVVAAGFLLMTRIGNDARYVDEVLPALLVVAIGMSGAVAPLTSAVLGSVDVRHTGSASGLNSALARTGGLVATALLGSVFVQHGPALLAAFHRAAIIGAALCVMSCICAFVMLRRARDVR